MLYYYSLLIKPSNIKRSLDYQFFAKTPLWKTKILRLVRNQGNLINITVSPTQSNISTLYLTRRSSFTHLAMQETVETYVLEIIIKGATCITSLYLCHVYYLYMVLTMPLNAWAADYH